MGFSIRITFRYTERFFSLRLDEVCGTSPPRHYNTIKVLRVPAVDRKLLSVRRALFRWTAHDMTESTSKLASSCTGRPSSSSGGEMLNTCSVCAQMRNRVESARWRPGQILIMSQPCA